MLASASAALLFATKETAFITLGTMLIACLSVWVWRALRQSLFVEKNWFNIVIGVQVVVIAAALYYRSTLADGWRWLNDNFLPGRLRISFFIR